MPSGPIRLDTAPSLASRLSEASDLRLGPRCRIIIVGRYEGSERNVEAGEQLAIDLDGLARDLDFAGEMLNARSVETAQPGP